MGGGADVMVLGADGLAARAEQRIHELEAHWSRFIGTSDISLANTNAGRPTQVSSETITLCSRARQAWEMTGGRYDPLLGVPLRQLGYDRTFASMDHAGPPTTVLPLPPGGTEGLLVDADRGSVTVPAGRQFDPGGIGKGLAGDLVVEDLLRAGARGVLVSLGGDVRVGGESPDGDGWPVAVEDPRTDQAVLFHARLFDGAIASSSRQRRCWTSGGLAQHHLLDPADGRPLHNGIVAMSVLAGSGWEAEALTKAAFVAGAADATGLLLGLGAEGVVVLDDGTCQWSPGLAGTGRGSPVNGQAWWYVTRASGIAAWATLGASALVGQLQARRWTPGRSPAWFVDLHRGLAGVGCAALLLHLVALVADNFTSFDLLDLLIPMRSDLSPGGVAWGILALYLIVAVEVTSLASRRLSWRAWRRIHYLGLGVFWLTTLHVLLTGTDAESPLWLAPAVIAAVGLAVLTVRRPLPGRSGSRAPARSLPFRDLGSPAGSEGQPGSHEIHA